MATQGVIVVTGATGHVGNVLVRKLLDRGESVRVMVLPGENADSLAGLDVERVEGDICNPLALHRAFRGASTVYHLAGLISILPGKTRILHAVNVVGTRNVVRACEECGIGRMVYASSVHALVEPPHGTAITESAGVDPSGVVGPYAQSKARATQAVIEGVARGLDAVIVFPSGVIGPYDFNVSEMGQVILDFVHLRLPAYVEGAYDFVDVRDVVEGMVAAGRKGRKGEGYILSGGLLTVSDLMAILEEVTGIRSPSVKVPFWVARTTALFAPIWSMATGTKPRLTSYSLRVLRSNALMDCSKARRELGFVPRPIRESITDAVAWFRTSGRWPVSA